MISYQFHLLALCCIQTIHDYVFREMLKSVPLGHWLRKQKYKYYTGKWCKTTTFDFLNKFPMDTY